MQLLHLLAEVLGVLGGLFALGVLGFVILTMWACAARVRECEDYD